MLLWIGAAIAAGILGACGPYVLARLPEPAEPAADKKLYADLAATPRLSLWLGLAAAIAAGILATRIGTGALITSWIFLAAAGALLSFIDWHTRLLPLRLVIPTYAVTLALVGLAAAIASDWSIITRGLIASVAVFVFFFVSWWFFPRGIGYGDVRLSGGLALALGALGWAEVGIGIYAGFVIGAVFALVLSRLHIVDAKAFAFGPYMFVGALVGAGWGPAIASLF